MFAFAIQPHREVRPESGLSIYEIYDMKACRITTLVGRGERAGSRLREEREQERVCFTYSCTGGMSYPFLLRSHTKKQNLRDAEKERNGPVP